MGTGLESVWQLFRRLLGAPVTAGTGDVELLDAFARRRDEGAFAELVRRHGPMVLGVCRCVLRDAHAADDAFQVTFLTLACKAASLRRAEALPAWLHRVALHVALRVRARGRRASEVEREATPMPRPEPSAEAAWGELPAVLDEELQRLPETLRGPLVLCGLEGKTHAEAARELGWPAGSLSKRLARGRELLRQRLARRGFEVGAAAAATLVGDATAAVSDGLLTTTVRGAVAVAAGKTAELSAATAALLREVFGAMFWTRGKMGVAVLLALALIVPAAGLGLLALGRADPPPTPRAAPPERKDEQPARAEGAGFGTLAAALGPKRFRFRSVLLAVAYSPDGNRLAVSDFNTIHLYDAAMKQELRTWDAPEGFAIRSLAFSPDGRTLATADMSSRLRFWEVATGKLRREFDCHSSGAWFVTFSPDGKLLATAGEEGDPKDRDDKFRFDDFAVRIWDVRTGKEVPAFAGGLRRGNCVAFSPNGQLLAWGGFDGTVHVRGITGGRDVLTVTEKDVMGKAIPSVDFSPDSKVLAVGTGKVIELFDVAAGKRLKTLAQPATVGQPALLDGYRVRFSPDGATLRTICQGGVALWDVASGKLRRVLKCPPGTTVTDMTFRRGGKQLANAVSDQSVRFWDLTTGEEELEPGHQGPVTAVALSPDGKLVVTGAYLESVRFWDRATGKELRRLPRFPVSGIVFVPDGLLIAGSGEDYLIRLFDPATGKEKSVVGKDLRVGMCMAVSADGKLLALSQSTIQVVELPSGKEKLTLPGHGSYCSAMAFGPGGKTLVSVGQETAMPQQLYAVKLWDLTRGKELRRLPSPAERAVTTVACSPDGRYVLTDLLRYDFGPPPIKDLAKGKVVEGPTLGCSPFGRRPMGFSPDGKVFAVGSESTGPKNQPVVELWDTATWEKVAVLEGHTQRVRALAFSADGRFLVSGSDDTSALVWNLARRKK